MTLGSESGFLVGAMSALVTNFYFGQGPWTPFQMFAWGMIGLIAGYLGDPLRRSRIALAVYGAFSGIAYSMIMDIWTVLWYGEGFNEPNAVEQNIVIRYSKFDRFSWVLYAGIGCAAAAILMLVLTIRSFIRQKRDQQYGY